MNRFYRFSVFFKFFIDQPVFGFFAFGDGSKGLYLDQKLSYFCNHRNHCVFTDTIGTGIPVTNRKSTHYLF